MPTKKATPQRKPHHRENESFQAAEKSYAAATQLFAKQSWAKARDAFNSFLKEHGANKEITDMLDRARTLARIAASKLSAPPVVEPTSPEEWLLQGVGAANEGRADDALKAFAKAEAGGVPAPQVNYARAAALALGARADEALEALSKAVEADAQLRHQAVSDPDFESLRDLPNFSSLIESPREAEDDLDEEADEDETPEMPFGGERDRGPAQY